MSLVIIGILLGSIFWFTIGCFCGYDKEKTEEEEISREKVSEFD